MFNLKYLQLLENMLFAVVTSGGTSVPVKAMLLYCGETLLHDHT